jgi:hypothetical protein
MNGDNPGPCTNSMISNDSAPNIAAPNTQNTKQDLPLTDPEEIARYVAWGVGLCAPPLTSWHYCAHTVDSKQCDYKTKNRNAMRVHLRTIHNVYYCEYCRYRWDKSQKQKWKEHQQKNPSGNCRY